MSSTATGDIHSTSKVPPEQLVASAKADAPAVSRTTHERWKFGEHGGALARVLVQSNTTRASPAVGHEDADALHRLPPIWTAADVFSEQLLYVGAAPAASKPVQPAPTTVMRLEMGSLMRPACETTQDADSRHWAREKGLNLVDG